MEINPTIFLITFFAIIALIISGTVIFLLYKIFRALTKRRTDLWGG